MVDTASAKIIVAGAAISNPLGEQGTLGLRVADHSGNPYGLTCAHVVAPPAIANPMNEKMDSPAQSRQHAGSASFGKVWTWSAFDLNKYNRADAALIVPSLGTNLSNDRLKLGATPSFVDNITSFLESAADKQVEIWRNGEPVVGQIDRVYDESDRKVFGFGGDKVNEFFFAQILGYRAEVQAGDSGAAVVHAVSRKVLGIHFANDPGMGYCILFQYIRAAFPLFKLSISA